MTVLRFIVALALGGGAIATVAAEPDSWLVQFQSFSPSKFFSTESGPMKPIRTTIHSESEWRRFWAVLEPNLARDMNQSGPHPMPSVDFKRYALIAVALGEKPTAGYFVAIESVIESPKEIRVSVIEVESGGCMVTLATTRPVTLALVPRSEKPFTFEVTRSKTPCE